MPRASYAADEYRRRPKKAEITAEAKDTLEKVESDSGKPSTVRAYLRLVKFKKEEREITGVVLEPDTFDAQKTIIKKSVIKKAASKFLANYNKKTKLGVQHEDFTKPFELYQSYIAPCNFVINGKVIKEGSWIIVLKVLDDEVWKKIKKGEITGFSIGGRAKIKKLDEAMFFPDEEKEVA